MVKKPGIHLPSGYGGLVGGLQSSYKTKIRFGPRVVIYFALLVVAFIWLLFKM